MWIIESTMKGNQAPLILFIAIKERREKYLNGLCSYPTIRSVIWIETMNGDRGMSVPPAAANIFSLTKYVQLLARGFGFWSFTIDISRKRGYVHTHFVNYAWFAFVVAVYSVSVGYQLVLFVDYLKNDVSYESTIEVTFLLVSVVGHAGISLVSLALDMVYRKFIWNIIVQLHAFDEKVFIKQQKISSMIASFIFNSRLSS